MFSLFKKKINSKSIILDCKSNHLSIKDSNIVFPTNIDTLKSFFGKPSRKIQKETTYTFWDRLGVYVSYTNPDEILSINFFQNKKDRSEYNTKKQFRGKLMVNDSNVSYSEFKKISLGDIVIYGLGGYEDRFGFSIGANFDYKDKNPST